MDLLTRLNRAMAYIEEHICDDMALADVSSVTNYSAFHFGRMFYYIADIPLSEYIRRRKLSLAALELYNSGVKVLDLAVKYGYDSADSFSRAFVKQHGVTPSMARQHGARLTIFPPLTFQIKIEGVRAMNCRIEQKEAFRVVGIERYFKNDETDKIPGFWGEVFADGTATRLRAQIGRNDLIGFCGHINEAEDSFQYLVGLFLEGERDTSGFTVEEVPALTWAVFTSGMFDRNPRGREIPTLWERAYKEWFPSSGYDRASEADVEVYGFADGKYYEEIWIPVKKQ